MPKDVVAILGPNGRLSEGEELPPIRLKEQIHLYRLMLLTRRVDEQMVRHQRQGRIGFYIGSSGEEAAIIGSAFSLRPTDWIIPCYRELGAALLRGFPLFDFFCQLLGNARDNTKGRQMPNHYGIEKLRFTSISSPVGNQIPQAVGIALASKIQGKQDVALVYFGDGAVSSGDFHVGANFAGVFKAPIVFFCRNNQWAISVPQNRQTASESVAIKAKAYGFIGVRVDGNDLFAVLSVTQKAVEKARRGEGPTLIEAVTYRQGGHSTSDDPRAYRSDQETREWQERDPLLRLRSYLIAERLLSKDDDARLEEEIRDEIRQTWKMAEKVGPPPLETLVEDVLDTVPWHLREQLETLQEHSR